MLKNHLAEVNIDYITIFIYKSHKIYIVLRENVLLFIFIWCNFELMIIISTLLNYQCYLEQQNSWFQRVWLTPAVVWWITSRTWTRKMSESLLSRSATNLWSSKLIASTNLPTQSSSIVKEKSYSIQQILIRMKPSTSNTPTFSVSKLLFRRILCTSRNS